MSSSDLKPSDQFFDTPKSGSSSCAPRTGGVRFAPSPTGHFHLGNLRTAWISHQLSLSMALPWVVRYEDIDRPRVVLGARDSQAADMEKLGLVPDIELLQSQFFPRHLNLFMSALTAAQVYPCDCSRREVHGALVVMASAPHALPPVYSGHCRELDPRRAMRAHESIAWRFKMPNPSADFIVARSSPALRDGMPSASSFVPAYHWACAIDDYDGGYEFLVRSSDLASVAPLQNAIYEWLASLEGRSFTPPTIFHTSLVTDNSGHRLEKRTAGVTLSELTARGFSVQDLLTRFQNSFREPTRFESSITCEPLATITLRDLGL